MVLLEFRRSLVEFMLISVNFDAGWTNRQQTLLTFAEIGDGLLGVISTSEFRF